MPAATCSLPGELRRAATIERMLHESPLRPLLETYAREIGLTSRPMLTPANRPGAAVGQHVGGELELIPYGQTPDGSQPACELVGSFGDVELEYAAIRRSATVFDSPHRGTILVTGNDRIEFLNRMLTQELKDLAAGHVRSSFWLSRQGRIQADLLLIELGDRMLIDVDIHQAALTVQTLSEFVFAEDVEFKDVSSEFHHIAIHGRESAAFLAAACGLAHESFTNNSAITTRLNNEVITIARRDQTGEPGFELIVRYTSAPEIWNTLVNAPQRAQKVRPIGWHAFNIARIEAGTPLFNIDFGNTNLPHETGILRQRVSFTKGCYLGQEIVARMESLGKPKQILVGLKVESDLLPVAGGQVFERYEDGSMGAPVGVVTSSTLSPMRSAAPIAFAMIKTAQASQGKTLIVNAEGQQVAATVHPLQFWPSPGADHDNRSANK